MATILIVEDDGVFAQHAAQVLRQMGHGPILAADVRAARSELSAGADVMLLDLGLPDLSREFLRWFPDMGMPVLGLVGREDTVVHLRPRIGSHTVILKKPLSDDHLCQAVTAALADRRTEGPPSGHQDEHSRWKTIQHLITVAPDWLATHVYCRVMADRLVSAGRAKVPVPSWGQIGEWAVREGLIDHVQALLLGQKPDGGRISRFKDVRRHAAPAIARSDSTDGAKPDK